jgi:polyvinyl alcohol dehydrogenase (cytochrome)
VEVESPVSRIRPPTIALAVVTALATVVPAAGASSAAPALPQHGHGSGHGDWPTWQGDLTGTRSNQAERAINPGNVAGLKLKWAYAYPKTGVPAKSQPAVVGDTLYVGGADNQFRALDARSGRTKWVFTIPDSDLGTGPAANFDGPAVVDARVFFGDSAGRVWALDTRTGRLLWQLQTETHPAALHTSSPLVYRGRVYIGASSAENTLDRSQPCCTFRGHIDAIDARTGRLDWRYYTVPPARRVGNWPNGAARFEPSGAGVWSSPVIDPLTGTLYVGTGQNYTGSAGDFDSMLALDARTGAVRWKQQLNRADTWRAACNEPDAEGFCPGLRDGTALDYDIGATPNIFRVGHRTLVGVGQKSGVYHVFDARTGAIVWQRALGVPLPSGGISGIQWGSSYDGRRLYIATYFADPGTLFALDPATGAVLWDTPNPADGCTTGGAAASPDVCTLAHTPAVSTTPGLVWEGSNDGKMRAYDARTGAVLWTYDTIRDFAGVNGLTGHGSSLSGNGGAVIAHGMVYVQAGYVPFYPSPYGTVLLAFGR